MMKNLIFAIVASILVSFCLSGSCSEKAILDDNYRLSNLATTDVKLAYNGPSSCATLTLDKGFICCYIKLKFENEDVDEKFTHEGCYEITEGDLPDYLADDEDVWDIEDLIDNVTANFEDNYKTNPRLTKKKLSIDCSSKYLTMVGFALLFILL